MSASGLRPLACGQAGESQYAIGGARRAYPLRHSVLVGCGLALILSGCSEDKPRAAEPTPTTASASPSESATPAGEQQLILAQYAKFWASLTGVSRMPADQRRAALSEFTVDPELKSLLAGMVATDRKGQVFYGAAVPSATEASLSPDGLRAVINDCQDSRNSGLARRSDLAPLTKGVAKNHVVVTMKKAADVWKIYFISYPKTPC